MLSGASRVLLPHRTLLPFSFGRCFRWFRYQSTYKCDSSIPSKEKEKEKEKVSVKPPTGAEGIKGKIALVTAAADGIGLICVRELLNCGAKGVMMADCSERMGSSRLNELCKKYGKNKVAFIRAETDDTELLQNAFQTTIEHFSQIDIVINNIRFKDNESWETQIDRNVRGMVVASLLSLDFMGKHKKHPGGTLVHIASNFDDNSASKTLFTCIEQFLICFGRTLAQDSYEKSQVKTLIISQATPESICLDLTTIISKGKNGRVWTPSP